jgi:hypothetical protein
VILLIGVLVAALGLAAPVLATGAAGLGAYGEDAAVLDVAAAPTDDRVNPSPAVASAPARARALAARSSLSSSVRSGPARWRPDRIHVWATRPRMATPRDPRAPPTPARS